MNYSMDSLFSVKDRVVVITGGGGILCGEMARALGALGARVAVVNRTESKAVAVADAIRAAGGVALAVPCDVMRPDSVRAARDTVVKELGPVDALVNGAGGNQKAATAAGTTIADPAQPNFFGLDVDAVQTVFALNFIGTLLPTQIVAEGMVARKRGNIVNVGSMAGIRPLTKVMGYAAAKAAVDNFTKWLATHLAPAGIRVNSIAPGFFLTEQNRFLLTDEKTGAYTPRGESIIRATPMARMGEPSDLVAALVYLLGDGSRFVTGTTMAVDGGFSAFGGV